MCDILGDCVAVLAYQSGHTHSTITFVRRVMRVTVEKLPPAGACSLNTSRYLGHLAGADGSLVMYSCLHWQHGGRQAALHLVCMLYDG